MKVENINIKLYIKLFDFSNEPKNGTKITSTFEYTEIPEFFMIFCTHYLLIHQQNFSLIINHSKEHHFKKERERERLLLCPLVDLYR